MKFIFLILLLLSPLSSFSQSGQEHDNSNPKMAWFQDAKLGIFIHWGIYAVNGIDESWSFFNGYISHEDYLKQLDGFTAERYDPQQWARLIRESGARYTVITSKHHDGVALWDSRHGDLNVPQKTPAGKDVLTPFVEAARAEGLKVGLYYSLPDWSYPDYPQHTRTVKRYEKDGSRWSKFLAYYQGQLRELADRYNPDLWWFDGDWEHSAEEWEAAKVRKMLLDNNPDAIINSRLAEHGDYATPEQGVPIRAPKAPYWELCMTMNDSWGFQHNDHNYKTPYQIIRIFADVIGMGGNLLLDIGPKADGTIPDEQIHILRELGKWTSRHQEAIFGTRAGMPPGYFYGPSTLSKEGDVLYLFLPGKPNGPVVLKGLKNKINRIRIAGNGTKLSHQILGKQYWSEVPGIVYIDVPDYVVDEYVTVIAVQLQGKIELYEE
jgi:alpha-L-fucosidase